MIEHPIGCSCGCCEFYCRSGELAIRVHLGIVIDGIDLNGL